MISAEKPIEQVVQSHGRSEVAGVAPGRALPRVGDPEQMGQTLMDGTDLASAVSSLHWRILRVLGRREAAVVLADTDGVVIDVFHTSGRSVFDESGLMVGVDLSEPLSGTNAVALALVEGRTVSVYGHEHWLQRLQALAGAAAPIVSRDNKTVGVLAVYVRCDQMDERVVQAVNDAVRAISKQLRKGTLRDTLNWLVMQEWNRFVAGKERHGIVDPEILASWERCRTWGVPIERDEYGVDGHTTQEDLELRRQNHALLLEVARPLMEHVSRQVNEADYAVALFDADGIILHVCATAVESLRSIYNLSPGFSCHERHIGTNGWGTSLHAGRALAVVGAEHYLRAAKEWASAGAPIRDSEGRVVAGLAVSVPFHSYHDVILGFVISAAEAIEKDMRLRRVSWKMDAYEAVRRMHETLDLNGTLDRIARHVRQLAGDDVCYIVQVPSDGEKAPDARAVVAWHPESANDDDGVWARPDATGDVWRGDQLVVVGRGDLNRLFAPDHVLRRGYASALMAPLQVDGRVWGQIVLAGKRRRYADELVEVVRHIVGEASRAVENALAHQLLGLITQRDALTDLLNRTGLGVSMRRMNDARSYACIFIDIDNFKRVNDTHGHACGDVVLREVASCIASCCRDSDLAARIGGDEFVAVLREAAEPAAANVAERIRTRVAAHGNADVTVSIGVAVRRAGETFDEVLARADEHMYCAKRNGRNQVAARM